MKDKGTPTATYTFCSRKMSFRRSMCSFEVIGRLRARSEERNYSNMKPIALIRRETDSCSRTAPNLWEPRGVLAGAYDTSCI